MLTMPTVAPPSLRKILATLPRTGAEARRFVQERTRESRAETVRKEKEHAETKAWLERMAGSPATPLPSSGASTFATSSARTMPKSGSAQRRIARPSAPVDDLARRAALTKTQPTAAKRIDPTAVYAAVNAKHDECGACGSHVPPSNGLRALNIQPAATKARSFAQLAGDVYGFLGGGEGPGLIQTSARGGGK